MSSEQELRDAIQPMVRDELMRTWREGVQTGLKMAHKMAGAVRDEAKRRHDEACTDEQREALGAQVAALSGLMSGLLTAAEEAVNPSVGGGVQ